MTSDFKDLILANPKYEQCVREQRVVAGKFALLALLVFADYLALLIAAPEWMAHPLWGGRMTVALPVTLWLIVFMIALARRYAAYAERAFDPQLDAIFNEAKRVF
ncbi:hypothetical protein AGMMS49545_10840 [Betaproteobacteria bacterium]|nr:hypothetical protein AGMMS49545_10840 [Betaproteobacteria bacterium]GHU44576.1 hypothetical protein AGMMS50289_13190 [Betaproteobacteria bacterium]